MPVPDSYTYPRYLSAKKTVDDRALNPRVWQTFLGALVSEADRDHGPLRVLEVGGGVGATVERLARALEKLAAARGSDEPLAVDYTLVDVNEANVEAARERLPEWGRENGFDVDASGEHVVWSSEALRTSIRLVTADAFAFADGASRHAFDALIVQAMLDIVNVPEALRRLLPLLRQRALLYLPIHFDGVTAFEPPVDPDLDRRIEQLYHRSMDRRRTPRGPVDGSRTGRRLFMRLREAGVEVLEAGPSDWVVFAKGSQTYPADEAYFMHYILHFVESELRGHSDLDSERFEAWIATRRQQLEDGTLVYIAHQLDFVGRLETGF